MRFLRGAALPTGIGVAVGFTLSVLGLQAEFAWGWAVLAAAITVATRMMFPDDPRADAPGRAAVPEYVGSDVSRMAWAINTQTDTVNEAVTRRARATLRRRLLRHGIDVDDAGQAAAVDRLLGEGVWARLNGHRTKVGDLRDAIAAAERLVAAPAPDSPAQNSTAPDSPAQNSPTQNSTQRETA
jgi:hypothetical protein